MARLTAPTSRPPVIRSLAMSRLLPAMLMADGAIGRRALFGSDGAPDVALTTAPDSSNCHTRSGSSRSGSSNAGPPGAFASWVSCAARRSAAEERSEVATMRSTATHSAATSAATVTVLMTAVRSACLLRPPLDIIAQRADIRPVGPPRNELPRRQAWRAAGRCARRCCWSRSGRGHPATRDSRSHRGRRRRGCGG